MSAEQKKMLALYDCRSKQSYIYRTNRIKEISGASALLDSVYDTFLELAAKKGINIKPLKDSPEESPPPFSLADFESSSYDGEVLYDGGGNLLIIYKSEDIYKKANRIFSRMLIDETYTVSAVSAAVPVSKDFQKDRKLLYGKNAENKNIGTYSILCNALPFTQLDRLTYMPIVKKEFVGGEQRDYSQESLRKKDKALEVEGVKDHDALVPDKGTESLLAIIYIDGNSMGARIKDETKNLSGYDECVNALRVLSDNINTCFVKNPTKAIDEHFKGKYRLVIGGGDEITLICNARNALKIVDTYFKSLSAAGGGKYSACAGIAIFHHKSPFADAYEIAEQCCECAKKRAHAVPGNYIDFHFCHAGITNAMEIVRERQEKITARPYMFGDELNEFDTFAERLGESDIGRSNIKELSRAILKGDAYYRYEVARVNSRISDGEKLSADDERKKQLIYDIAVVYDLWFGKEEAENEQH